MRRRSVRRLGLHSFLFFVLLFALANIFLQSSKLLPLYEQENEHGINSQLLRPLHTTPNDQQNIPLQSSLLKIRYVGVAGLGHRLIRMSSAYHLARVLHVTPLDVFWKGFCPRRYKHKPNIFQLLFGDDPLQVPSLESDHTNLFPFLNHSSLLSLQCHLFSGGMNCNNSTSIIQKKYPVKLFNEVEGYTHLYSNADVNGLNPPFFGKIDTDYEFYTRLIQRFQFQSQANELLADYAKTHTIIGIHVRAGNGEAGDFEEFRQLGQGNVAGWLKNLTSLLVDSVFPDQSLVPRNKPPVIFLATDTEAVVDYFKTNLKNFPVVVTPQHYPTKGEGVSYNGYHANLSMCLDSWKYQMIDMYTLSEKTDILIAGQYSSFTQSIPLSRILNDPHRSRYFCDVDKMALAMKCYSSKYGMAGWLSVEGKGSRLIGNIGQANNESFAGPQVFFPVQLTMEGLQQLIQSRGMISD